jgi:hypothetical protein
MKKMDSDEIAACFNYDTIFRLLCKYRSLISEIMVTARCDWRSAAQFAIDMLQDAMEDTL